MNNILKTFGICSLLLAAGCATMPPRITKVNFGNDSIDSIKLTSEYKRGFATRVLHPTYALKVESSSSTDFKDSQFYDSGRFFREIVESSIPLSTNRSAFYRIVVEN
jgi:hypothetical protein